MAEGVFAIRDLQDKLVAKAMKDESFASQLRSDPKGTVQKELAAQGVGVSLPANLEVKILESSPETWYLMLPPRAAAGGELSDAQLELVSGGGYSDEVNTCCAISGSVGEPSWC